MLGQCRGPPSRDPLWRAARDARVELPSDDSVEPQVLKVTDEGVRIYEGDFGQHWTPGPENPWTPGRVMWRSGRALAKFFAWGEGNPAGIGACAGKTALELGAGTGVVGLTLGRLGAEVTLTDGEPRAVDLLRRNIAANALEASATARRLWFGDTSTYLAPQIFDFVVAADVIYGSGQDLNGALLAHALEAHVSEGSVTQVFLAYEYRSNVPSPAAFFCEMVAHGFCLERLEDCEGRAVGDTSGDHLRVYDGSHFVALLEHWASEEIHVEGQPRERYMESNIQIFRLTRPGRRP